MSLDMDILLGKAERKTGGHANLFAHKIHVAHHLGDGMLHLYARVHLDEVELPRMVEHKLHRSSVLIAGGTCGGNCGRTHTLT